MEITIDGYTITKLPPRKVEQPPDIPDPYGFEAFRVRFPEDPPASMFIEDKSDPTRSRGWRITVTPDYKKPGDY